LAVFTSFAKFFGDESSSDADLPLRASVCKVTPSYRWAFWRLTSC
jgi:hypothetical protein